MVANPVVFSSDCRSLVMHPEESLPNRVTASCVVHVGCHTQIVRFWETVCSSAPLADQEGAGMASLAGLGRGSGNGGVAMTFEVPGPSFEGEPVRRRPILRFRLSTHPWRLPAYEIRQSWFLGLNQREIPETNLTKLCHTRIS